MFVMMLVACVGLNAADCTWITSPSLYASSQRCADQAALIAGTERARAARRSTFAYRFRCVGGPDDPGRWIAVVNGHSYPLDIADAREPR
ncbi:MAG: hypothetical protein ACTS3R_04535 [Inquilinaceae bacterium]